MQVAGEATYVDDIKLSADALVGALVTSSKPHARLVSVDASRCVCVLRCRRALCVGFYTSNDLSAWE